MKRLILCDMDGVLANNEQREHLLPAKDDCNSTDKWEAFNQACDKDAPIELGFTLLANLCTHDRTDRVLFALWSGRTETVGQKSREWFLAAANHLYKPPYYRAVLDRAMGKSYFRAEADHRPAAVCKADLVKQAVLDAKLVQGDELVLIDDDLSVLQECRDAFPHAVCVWVGSSHCKAKANGVTSK